MMPYSSNRFNALINVRNPGIPDVFALDYNGHQLFVHISPYVWIRPWEGSDHTAFSIGLAPGCPNACRMFGRINVPYLEVTLEDVKQAVYERITHSGIGFLTSRSAGVKSFAIHPRGGFTSISESQAYQSAYENGYRYVVHVYQLRSGGLGRQFAEWFYFGEPDESNILAKIRRQQSKHPESMHFEICQLSAEVSATA